VATATWELNIHRGEKEGIKYSHGGGQFNHNLILVLQGADQVSENLLEYSN